MLLSIEKLSISFESPLGRFRAVDEVSLQLRAGEALGLIGESGCGKSVTASAILGLSKYNNARIDSGRILFDGRDLAQMSDQDLRSFRGRRAAMIFQEPMTSLNPVFKVGDQIAEALAAHQKLSAAQLRERSLDLMNTVGIPDPERRFDFYPHELSGGLRQRIMIAMALSCNPELLIADEPTTALDVTIQAQILRLIRKLQKDFNMSLLIISHDFGVVSETTDRVAVMYAGKIVEDASTEEILQSPKHPYTRALQRAIPAGKNRRQRLFSIPFSVPRPSELIRGFSLDERWRKLESHLQLPSDESLDEEPTSPWAIDPSGEEITDKRATADEVILNVEALSVEFLARAGGFSSGQKRIRAVDDVSFHIRKGETLGLVGESGCGKSTLARSLVELVRPASGSITFKNLTILENGEQKSPLPRKDIQMVFQDPYSSLNPRLRVEEILEEALKIHFKLSRFERKQRIKELLDTVGLSEEVSLKYPHEFSGGQRQRIGIARALAVKPEFLIADEPVSALDVSIQAQILNLLQDLKRQFNLTLLFISHDLNVIEYLCDRVLVMKSGKIVEELRSVDIHNPRVTKNPYTQQLLDSIPKGYSKLSSNA
jgi:peptide/nickel transport system ATP-binding protein